LVGTIKPGNTPAEAVRKLVNAVRMADVVTGSGIHPSIKDKGFLREDKTENGEEERKNRT